MLTQTQAMIWLYRHSVLSKVFQSTTHDLTSLCHTLKVRLMVMNQEFVSQKFLLLSFPVSWLNGWWFCLGLFFVCVEFISAFQNLLTNSWNYSICSETLTVAPGTWIPRKMVFFENLPKLFKN